MDIRNKRIPDAEFEALRSEVLTQWPTGRDVNLDEAVAYHKSMPESRVFSKKLLKAKQEHRTLIQPRAGVPVVEKHIELLQHLEKYGEADLLPTTIDSYTRQNRYKEAENGISESIRLDRAMLNGFPAVNHGVANCRKVIESVNVPVQIRHGTPDARLLAEITFAGGFTSYEGGGISYNLPYCKNVPMERTITDWQYVDRLTGLYEEMGVPINREPYGPLTGTLVPPCISHAAAIIEALLAAEQGVKNITVGYGQCGNLIQDIAAIHTLEELTDEYLAKYGYNDVTVTTVLVCAARSRWSTCWRIRSIPAKASPRKRRSSVRRPVPSWTSASSWAAATSPWACAAAWSPARWTCPSRPAARTPV